MKGTRRGARTTGGGVWTREIAALAPEVALLERGGVDAEVLDRDGKAGMGWVGLLAGLRAGREELLSVELRSFNFANTGTS